MSSYWHEQLSFNGGQISRRLWPRTDIGIHAIALAKMFNAVTSVEGAAVKRPGTYYRAAALSTASRLTEFIFNATQAYVLEWSPGKFRFVTNDALIESGGSPYEVVHPYLADEIDRVAYEQSGDVLYLAHANHAPAALSRTAATTFSYAELDLAGGPFADPNTDDSITVSVTGALAVGGTVTITSSSGIFQSGHVGSRFRVETEDFSAIRAWQEGMDGVTIGAVRRSEGRVYQAATAGTTGYNQPTHDKGTEWDGDDVGVDVNGNGPFGVQWTYLHDRFGIIKITGYTSATQVKGTVERRVPNNLTNSPLWAHGLFSSVEGWPEHVFLWRGRLWWISGFILAGSVAGDYRDYNEYGRDGARDGDQAIRLRMDITDRVLWVKADRDQVILGTARGEYAIRLINPAEGVEAANLTFTRQRKHGSQPVWPAETGGEIFFVQRGGRKIRAATYAFDDDRYRARWANLYARFATEGGVTELAFQAEPEEIMWALQAGGNAAAHTVNVEQDVKGWATGLAIEGATVKSFVSIPSPDGGRDDLWLLIDRGGNRSLQQLAEWPDTELEQDLAAAYYLDDGMTFTLTAQSTINGLTHLANETVTLLLNGEESQVTVSPTGEIALEEEATGTAHVGRLYTVQLQLLNPQIPKRDGSSLSRLRKSNRIALYIIDGVAVTVGQVGKLMERLIKFVRQDTMPTVQPLSTGWTDPRTIGGDRLRNIEDLIEDRSPYPLIVSGAVRELESE